MRELGAADTVLCTAMMGFGPLRGFIEAAGAAEFDAISVSGGDYKSARAAGLSDADIRSLLSDNNLRVAELDGIVDWLRPLPNGQGLGYSLVNPFFGHTTDEFLAIGSALGARSVTVVDPFAGTVPLAQMVDAFGGICDRAREQGLLVHLEFLSWGPVPDLATAWDIVRLANCSNGGIMLDTLHLMRSGSRALLAQIPGEKILATQFCDGTATRTGDAFDDAANRLMPGEGEFGLPAILAHLRQSGSNAPLGIEVMSDKTRNMTPTDLAEQANISLTMLKALVRS